ncbi:MAG: UDP-2,3-diacylglucosamine diphosphatase [Phocaeicola sp.]
MKKFKTIVLSDIHLGTKFSKAKEAAKFLEENSCDTLILCGDIVDGWSLSKKKSRWKRKHTRFIKTLLDLQHNTNIIYIRGNHDDFLDTILPLKFQNISIVRDLIYESCGKRFLVLHGDIFDHITSRFSWLAKIGDWGYTLLLNLNKHYNNKRLRKGLPYYSLSKKIKMQVKASVSYISDFEKHLVDVATTKRCDGVICGHIHQAEIKQMGSVLYLNSGDWVESLSALVEDYSGNWEIKYSTEMNEDASTNINEEVSVEMELMAV